MKNLILRFNRRTGPSPWILALLVATAGCRSSGGQNDLGGGLFGGVDGDLVVMQAGDKSTTLGPYSNAKWLEIYKAEKDPLRKVHALLATGDALEAERGARNLLQAKPGDPEGLLALASALAESRQYELAGYYAEQLEKNPKMKPYALNIKGLALLQNASSEQEFHEAEQEFLAAHKANSKQIAAGLNLGTLYLEVGNANAAMSIFQETSVRCGKCQPALLGYGIAALRSRKFKEAEAALYAAVDRDGSDASANYHLALVHWYGSKSRSKAEAAIKRLLQGDSQANGEIRQRAQVLLKKVRGDKDDGADGFLDNNLGGDERTEEILTRGGR